MPGFWRIAISNALCSFAFIKSLLVIILFRFVTLILSLLLRINIVGVAEGERDAFPSCTKRIVNGQLLKDAQRIVAAAVHAERECLRVEVVVGVVSHIRIIFHSYILSIPHRVDLVGNAIRVAIHRQGGYTGPGAEVRPDQGPDRKPDQRPDQHLTGQLTRPDSQTRQQTGPDQEQDRTRPSDQMHRLGTEQNSSCNIYMLYASASLGCTTRKSPINARNSVAVTRSVTVTSTGTGNRSNRNQN